MDSLSIICIAIKILVIVRRGPRSTAAGIVSSIVRPTGAVGEEVISHFTEERMEAPPGFEPGMEVLQTSALATWLCRQC